METSLCTPNIPFKFDTNYDKWRERRKGGVWVE